MNDVTDETDDSADERLPYRVTEVHHGYFNQAVWNAVYSRLASPALHADPAAAIEAVVLQRLGLLRVLRGAGYAPLQDEDAYRKACRCPPVSTQTDTSHQGCRLQRICPFCWSRQIVYKIWNRLFPELFPGKRKTCARGLAVLYFRETSHHASVVEAVRHMRERPVGYEKLGESGSAIVQSCYPDGGRLAVRQSGICLIRKGQEVPEREGFEAQTYDGFNKTAAAKLVGSICRFPVELFRCEAALAVSVLHGLGRARQCRLSGSLYEKEDKQRRNS